MSLVVSFILCKLRMFFIAAKYRTGKKVVLLRSNGQLSLHTGS